MSWHHRLIDSWDTFESIVSIAREHSTRDDRSVLFRGQSRVEWQLTPSLHRCLPPGTSPEQSLALEGVLLERFRARIGNCAPDVAQPEQHQLFAWWALMQHYGAPTRLIDWTTSLHVAAYFASREDWDRDGSIWLLSPWVLHQDAGMRMDPEEPLEIVAQRADAPHVVVPLPSNDATNRMSAQASHFTCCVNVKIDQAEAIDEMFTNGQIDSAEQFHWKLVLPAALKVEFMFKLEEAGASAETLFPGLDGLGQSLTELGKCAAHRQASRLVLPNER